MSCPLKTCCQRLLSILLISRGATGTVRIFAHGPSTSTLSSIVGLVEPKRACVPCQTESKSPVVPQCIDFQHSLQCGTTHGAAEVDV